MSPSTRSPSPNLQDHIPHIFQDHELHDPPSRTHPASHLTDHDMGHSKERSHLEIVLDADHLTLRGTGVDVESARLSGHVVLYLAEDTPLKEITLQFRGKARMPISATESGLLNSNASPVTYVVCNHEWSFLEGIGRHAHTLKAGRHTFPFHLQVGGSLPSTISTSCFGGASVCYKLRAVAVRPGLSHNLHVIAPVYIDRSFSNEALEYQQTLEIENTWPEKVMYSIVLPHKAWPAGDKLAAILKFSPLAKGVHISRIRTTIHETVKVYARSGTQENTHVVASIDHAIVDGKTTILDSRNRFSLARGMRSRNDVAGSGSGTPGNASPSNVYPPMCSPSPASPSSTDPSTNLDAQNEEGDNDLTITISIPLPITPITPTHSVEPIIVSHRVRWSILIRNTDGHTSELRCSLPIHILDNRLFEEARSFSAATRRLVLGSSDLPYEEEDRELPSYAAHIRDRVANMFLPEGATVRVNNPWINHIGSPQSPVDAQESFFSFPSSRARSGGSTPLEPHNLAHLPYAPNPDGIVTLDVLNSELLLSLSDSPLRRDFSTPEPRSPSEYTPIDSSQSLGESRSMSHSRHNSRPPSPDGSHHHDGATVHHGSGYGRNLHSIFRATLKPFTSLGQHHSLFSRHGSQHSHSEHNHHPSRSNLHSHESAGHHSSRPGTIASADPVTGADLLHRAFTEVPDYSIASRGFIGGVPPLESMRGLPSYEEAARTTGQRATSSDTDLTSSRATPEAGAADGIDVCRPGSIERRTPLERGSSFPLASVTRTTHG